MNKGTPRVFQPWRCPKCDSGLFVEQLMVEDESGSVTVFFIDCPWGDVNTAMTDEDVTKIMVDMVMEHMRLSA